MKQLKVLQQGLLSFCICFLLLLFMQDLKATHGAGGTVRLECVDTANNTYKAVVIWYRDLTGAGLPPQFTVHVDPVNPTEASDQTVEVFQISMDTIEVPKVHSCHEPPEMPSLRYANYRYESGIFTLNAAPSGYNVYTGTFCCRNPEILNITSNGQRFYARMPDPAQYSCNMVPIFDSLPPVELCKGLPVNIDHSATDMDGDSLAYSFCSALDNGTYERSANPSFPSVSYAPGFSASYPVPSDPPLTIDAETGEITGTPNQLGVYVVKVCVDEYRNDTLIGSYGREIQLIVVQCKPYEANINTGPGDTIVSCDMTVDFEANSGANSHLWQFDYPSGTDTSDQENPTYTYSDTGTYTAMYVAEANEPCADTTFATVIVMDSASASHQFLSVSTSDGEICPNDTLQLTASGADQYQWLTPSFSFPCDTCASNILILDNTTEFVVEGMKNGCANYDTTTIEVREPSGLFTSDTVEVCAGDSIQLSAQFGNNLEWDSSPDLSCTQCPAPYAYPATGTWFYATGTDSFGCESYDSVYVAVYSDPSLEIAPSDTSICKGGVAVLEAQSQAGSYAWSHGDTSVLTEVSPNSTTDYFVTVTDSNGCTATEEATVDVNMLQPGSFSNDTAICAGDSVQIYASGFTLFQWSPGHSLSNSMVPQPTALPDTTTTYTVVVEDNNGCHDTGSVTVTVNPLPNVTASANAVHCEYDTTYLNASGAQSYQWEPAGKVINDTSATTLPYVIDTAVSSVTYTVTGVNAAGCSDTGQVTVKFSWMEVDLSPSTANICQGDTLKLVATGAKSYQWVPGPGIPPQPDDTLVVAPSSSTSYTVVGTDSLGCTDEDEAFVEVDEYADVYGQITNSNGSPLTEEKVYLIKYNPIDSSLTALDSAITADTTGHYHFETQETEVYVKVAPDTASYPNEMPTYYDSSLTWSNATKITLQDCDSVEASFSTIAGNNPGGPGFISGKLSEGAGKHLWSGDPITSTTLFLMNEAGEPVTYAVTDGDGWFEMSDLPIGEYTMIGDIPHLRNVEAPTIEVTNEVTQLDSLVAKVVDNKLEVANLPTGMEQLREQPFQIDIYPNPASDVLHLEVEAQHSVRTDIIDLNGRQIATELHSQGDININLESMKAGLYIIRVTSGGSSVLKKFTITK